MLLSGFLNTSDFPLCSRAQQIWLWLATMIIHRYRQCLKASSLRESVYVQILYFRDPLIDVAFKCSHVYLCKRSKCFWEMLLSSHFLFIWHCHSFREPGTLGQAVWDGPQMVQVMLGRERLLCECRRASLSGHPWHAESHKVQFLHHSCSACICSHWVK